MDGWIQMSNAPWKVMNFYVPEQSSSYSWLKPHCCVPERIQLLRTQQPMVTRWRTFQVWKTGMRVTFTTETWHHRGDLDDFLVKIDAAWEEEQPLGVWDSTEGVGPYVGGWTIVGSQDTKGWRSKSPFSFFGALCPGSVLGKDIEVLPCPSDCGSCSRSFLKLFSSKGRGTRGITVNDPLWAPAFPSVRWGWECFTYRIAENSQWYTWANPCHCGYCGIVNAWINSGHFFFQLCY